MVIMPGLMLSGGNSIFKILNDPHVGFAEIVKSFKLHDAGTFFINLIFQSVGLGF